MCVCHITLFVSFIMTYPYQSYAYFLMYNVRTMPIAPSDDVNKRQQAFLALLPGMASEQRYFTSNNLGFVMKI